MRHTGSKEAARILPACTGVGENVLLPAIVTDDNKKPSVLQVKRQKMGPH